MPVCFICKKRLSFLIDIWNHFKIIHRLDTTSNIKCNEVGCIRSFSSISDYRRHWNLLHANQEVPLMDKHSNDILIFYNLTNKVNNFDDQSNTDLIGNGSSNNSSYNVIDLMNQMKTVESSDISRNNLNLVNIEVVTNTAPLRTQE